MCHTGGLSESGGTLSNTMSALFELPTDTPVQPRTERGAALLEGLNPRQREAVVHAGSPLLIVAGAGSGKTRVLTHRIAWLLAERGAHPGEIMSITFTNKAAAEMKARVDSLVGRRGNAMWVSTFHSMCVRILRREAKHLGVRSAFSVYDADDTRRLVGLVTRDLELDPKKFSARGVAAQISNFKNELLSADDAAERAANDFERKVAEVYAVYQARLHTANAFDFDDLIMETVALLQRLPAVAEYYRRRFRHVLVDEYQDTNHAQYALVRELVAPAADGVEPGELCVVGDSDQSIYAFRGANIRNIIEFEQDFPNARTIMLEQNYRSTQHILTAANAVIARNPDRRDKRLWSDQGDGAKVVGYVADNEHDEAAFVAQEIDRLVDSGEVRNSDVAVFYRTNSQSRVFEDVFMRVGLPYKVVGGVRFYERKEVRDALAYLRVLSNPEDTVSLRRILNVPKRGIGERAEELVATYADRERISFAAALRIAAEQPERIPGLVTRSQRCIASFVRLLDELYELVERGEETAEILEAVYARTGYTAELEASDDPQDGSRRENLAELVTVAREFAGDAAVADLDDSDVEVGAPAAWFARRVPGARRPGRRRRLHPRQRRGHGHADDPAHGEGPGVPDRVPHRLGGRRVPAHAGHGRPGRAGRGAAPRLRRHHARAGAALPVPGDDPLVVRAAQRQPGVPVPRRGARRPGRLAARRARALGPRGPLRVRPPARCHRPRQLERAEGGAQVVDLPRRRRPRQPRQVRPRHRRRVRQVHPAGADRLRQRRHRPADAHRRSSPAEALALQLDFVILRMAGFDPGRDHRPSGDPSAARQVLRSRRRSPRDQRTWLQAARAGAVPPLLAG